MTRSRRDRDLISDYSAGYTVAALASKYGLSEDEVQTIIRNLYRPSGMARIHGGPHGDCRIANSHIHR